MSSAYASTFSLDLSVAETGTDAGSETTSIDSTSLSLAVETETSPSTDGDGLAIELGGDAIAIGEDTLATAQVDVAISGDGAVQSASAFGEFTAWGYGDEATYASATSYTDITGDADYSFSLDYTTVTTSLDDGSSEWSATSLTEAFALDIDNIPFGDVESDIATGDPVSVPDETPSTTADDTGSDCSCDCGDGPDWDLTVDGNLALFDVTVVAVGDDSFAQVDFSALTVEDQLSSVTTVVTAAID